MKSAKHFCMEMFGSEVMAIGIFRLMDIFIQKLISGTPNKEIILILHKMYEVLLLLVQVWA